MTSAFDLAAVLRRVKPERQRAPLAVREVALLGDGAEPTAVGPVLLDTCVYLDNARAKLPAGALRLVSGGRIFHGAASIAELTYTFGRLDSMHPASAAAFAFLRDVLARIPMHRTVHPDTTAYATAGLITGTLARTQRLPPPERRRILVDALILMTARQHGLSLLTANVTDFDLIHQLVPDAKVVYYQPRRTT